MADDVVVKVFIPSELGGGHFTFSISRSSTIEVVKRKALFQWQTKRGGSYVAPMQFLLSKDIGNFEETKNYFPTPLFSRLKLSDVFACSSTKTPTLCQLQLIVCERLITTANTESVAKVGLKVRVFLPPALGGGFETFVATSNTLSSTLKAQVLIKRRAHIIAKRKIVTAKLAPVDFATSFKLVRRDYLHHEPLSVSLSGAKDDPSLNTLFVSELKEKEPLLNMELIDVLTPLTPETDRTRKEPFRLTGMLKKSSRGTMRTRRKRFVVCEPHDRQMKFYTSQAEHEASVRPRRVLFLDRITAIGLNSLKPSKITLDITGEALYELEAESWEAAAKWCHCLCNVIARVAVGFVPFLLSRLHGGRNALKNKNGALFAGSPITVPRASTTGTLSGVLKIKRTKMGVSGWKSLFCVLDLSAYRLLSYRDRSDWVRAGVPKHVFVLRSDMVCEDGKHPGRFNIVNDYEGTKFEFEAGSVSDARNWAVQITQCIQSVLREENVQGSRPVVLALPDGRVIVGQEYRWKADDTFESVFDASAHIVGGIEPTRSRANSITGGETPTRAKGRVQDLYANDAGYFIFKGERYRIEVLPSHSQSVPKSRRGSAAELGEAVLLHTRRASKDFGFPASMATESRPVECASGSSSRRASAVDLGGIASSSSDSRRQSIADVREKPAMKRSESSGKIGSRRSSTPQVELGGPRRGSLAAADVGVFTNYFSAPSSPANNDNKDAIAKASKARRESSDRDEENNNNETSRTRWGSISNTATQFLRRHSVTEASPQVQAFDKHKAKAVYNKDVNIPVENFFAGYLKRKSGTFGTLATIYVVLDRRVGALICFDKKESYDNRRTPKHFTPLSSIISCKQLEGQKIVLTSDNPGKKPLTFFAPSNPIAADWVKKILLIKDELSATANSQSKNNNNNNSTLRIDPDSTNVSRSIFSPPALSSLTPHYVTSPSEFPASDFCISPPDSSPAISAQNENSSSGSNSCKSGSCSELATSRRNSIHNVPTPTAATPLARASTNNSLASAPTPTHKTASTTNAPFLSPPASIVTTTTATTATATATTTTTNAANTTNKSNFVFATPAPKAPRKGTNASPPSRTRSVSKTITNFRKGNDSPPSRSRSVSKTITNMRKSYESPPSRSVSQTGPRKGNESPPSRSRSVSKTLNSMRKRSESVKNNNGRERRNSESLIKPEPIAIPSFKKTGFAELPSEALLTLLFLCEVEEASVIPCVCTDWRDDIAKLMMEYAQAEESSESEDDGEQDEEEDDDVEPIVETELSRVNCAIGDIDDVDVAAREVSRSRALSKPTTWSANDVPIAIDNGSAFMKGGMAIGTEPTLIFPTVRGFPSAVASKPTIMLGGQLQDGLLENYLQIGKVDWRKQPGDLTSSQWGDMELMWLYMLESLKVDVSQHPILLSLPFHLGARDQPNKNKLANYMKEVVLETFGAPAVYVADTPLLTTAAYSSSFPDAVEGALVCHMGENACTVTGVVNWEELPNCYAQECALGGRNLSKQLLQRIKGSGKNYSFMPTWVSEQRGGIREEYMRTWLAREIKTKTHCAVDKESYFMCRVNNDVERRLELKRNFSLPWSDAEYLWLDFELLDIGEIPFQPQTILHNNQDDVSSVVDLIVKSLENTPLDLRPVLRQNILLSGGTTLMPNFAERLQRELCAELSTRLPGSERGVAVRAEWWRGNAKWWGGACLSNMPWFQEQWEFK